MSAMETAHVMGKTGSEELVRVHCYFRGLVVVSQDMPGELRARCVVSSMQYIGVRLSCPQRTLLDTFTGTQVWKDEIWQEGTPMCLVHGFIPTRFCALCDGMSSWDQQERRTHRCRDCCEHCCNRRCVHGRHQTHLCTTCCNGAQTIKVGLGSQ